MTIHDMERVVSAVVLAGGRSVRMGRDKASIVVDGRTLLQRAIDAVSPLAEEVLVSCRAGQPVPPATYEGRGVRIVFDERGEGPLAGIAAGLAAARAEWLLAVPVDMPGLRTQALRELVGAVTREPHRDVAVFETDAGPLPLPMLVRRGALPSLTAQLERSDYRVTHFLDVVDVVAVRPEAIDANQLARNANTPDDLPGGAGSPEVSGTPRATSA